MENGFSFFIFFFHLFSCIIYQNTCMKISYIYIYYVRRILYYIIWKKKKKSNDRFGARNYITLENAYRCSQDFVRNIMCNNNNIILYCNIRKHCKNYIMRPTKVVKRTGWRLQAAVLCFEYYLTFNGLFRNKLIIPTYFQSQFGYLY